MEKRYTIEGTDRFTEIQYSLGVEIPTYDIIKYIGSLGNRDYYEEALLAIL